MRKALCLVFLGCALVVGLACSGDSTTPTAPAATGLQSVSAASQDKIYICHGDRSEPTGVIVEVTDLTIKRHNKHISSGRDCVCSIESLVGEPCNPTSTTGTTCDSCPD